MPALPQYRDIIRSVTLGTVRRPPGEEVLAWLDELGAIDPTADAAEQVLMALGITERMQRMVPLLLDPESLPAGSMAPPEQLAPASPRLARGLELILNGTYPELLDEAVSLLEQQRMYVPPALLPLLLPRAVALLPDGRAGALRVLAAGGERAGWLAAQHPDWSVLTPDHDFPATWRAAEQVAGKSEVLRQWREVDRDAAMDALEAIWDGQSPRNQEVLLEGLRPSVRPADADFLRRAMQPKRKGVRRLATELLLLTGDRDALADLSTLAGKLVQADGSLGPVIPAAESKEVVRIYGGVKAPETLAQRLLELLPPRSWPAITKLPAERFWARRSPLELRGAARALLAYDDPELTAAFVRFLLEEEPSEFPLQLGGELVRRLPAETFDGLYAEWLAKEKDALRIRSFARYLALQRNDHWSERLSKAVINRMLDDLHRRELDYATQRDLALHWKQATPLLHPDIFPWLRQQLHASTERYDAFGKLATRMLQVTSFRRQLREG